MLANQRPPNPPPIDHWSIDDPVDTPPPTADMLDAMVNALHSEEVFNNQPAHPETRERIRQTWRDRVAAWRRGEGDLDG